MSEKKEESSTKLKLQSVLATGIPLDNITNKTENKELNELDSTTLEFIVPIEHNEQNESIALASIIKEQSDNDKTNTLNHLNEIEEISQSEFSDDDSEDSNLGSKISHTLTEMHSRSINSQSLNGSDLFSGLNVKRQDSLIDFTKMWDMNQLEKEDFNPYNFINQHFGDKGPSTDDIHNLNLFMNKNMNELKLNIDLQQQTNYFPETWHTDMHFVSKVHAMHQELESMIVEYHKVTGSLQQLLSLKDNLHIGISYVNKYQLLIQTVGHIFQSMDLNERRNQLDLLAVSNLCCSALSLAEEFQIKVDPISQKNEKLNNESHHKKINSKQDKESSSQFNKNKDTSSQLQFENVHKSQSQRLEMFEKIKKIRDFIIEQMELELSWRGKEGNLSKLEWICNIEFLEYYRPGLQQLVIKSIRKGTVSLYKKQFKEMKDQEERLLSIPARFRWLKQHLRKFQQEHTYIPSSWNVLQEITLDFCKHFKKFIELTLKMKSDCNVTLLYKALQHTISFERSMDEKFSRSSRDTSNPNNNDLEKNNTENFNITNKESNSENYILENNTNKSDKIKEYKFTGFISPSFSSYMQTAYINHEDSKIQQVVAKVISKSLTEEVELLGYIDSNIAQDIFIVIEQSCNNCVAFNNSNILFGLVQNVWKQQLNRYATYLIESLQKATTETTSKTREMAKKIFTLQYFKDTSSSQSEDKNMIQLKETQIHQVCRILSLAEHCQIETEALENHVKKIIDEKYLVQVSFIDERGLFLKSIKNCCDLIVGHLLTCTIPGLEMMIGLDWKRPTCIRESDYCLTIESGLESALKIVAPKIVDVHFRVISQYFIIRFTSHFQESMYKLKGISMRGAQQLEIDIFYLKEIFRKKLHSHQMEQMDKDDIIYFQKHLSNYFIPIESLIRVLRAEPHQILQSYKREIPSQKRSTEDFHKIIEMKSDISKQDLEILYRIIFNNGKKES